MKTVILAGGLGTRLSEETSVRPKPMVEIGGRPILWHIMRIYYAHGIREFVICCGYKSDVIKEYFANYVMNVSNVSFEPKKNIIEVHDNGAEDWRVTLVDTGDETMTGGRLKRVKDYLNGETFCLTYGDGVTDANIREVINFHKAQKSLATLLAVQPPGRFGAFHLHASDTQIQHFREKPPGDSAWANGGFFVLEPEVIDYIDGDATVWEQDPMENLAKNGQLSAYRHQGFWHPMDTLRDKNVLDELWNSGKAPWKVW